MQFLFRCLAVRRQAVRCGLLSTLAGQQVQNSRVGECEGHAGLNIERGAITALNAAHLLSQSIAVFSAQSPNTSKHSSHFDTSYKPPS